jgi:hypothetical protein
MPSKDIPETAAFVIVIWFVVLAETYAGFAAAVLLSGFRAEQSQVQSYKGLIIIQIMIS